MIAKPILIILVVITTCFVFGRTGSEEISDYMKVANEYAVTPPKLENGYPIWYRKNYFKNAKIIFLKNDVYGDIRKLNDTAYVAEPTAYHAKVISKFSGELHNEQNFVVIPDTNVTYFELMEFCDSLIINLFKPKVIFISSNRTFFPMNYINRTLFDDLPAFCGHYNRFQIDMNNIQEILVEGDIIPLDSVESATYQMFKNNWNEEYDGKSFEYKEWNPREIKHKIKQFDEYIKRQPKKDEWFIKEDQKKYLKMFDWVIKYPPFKLKVMRAYDFTEIELYGRNLGVSPFYDLLNEYAKGLKKARNDISLEFFKKRYESLIATRQFDKAAYIDFQLKDCFRRILEYRIFGPPTIEDITVDNELN